MRRFILVTTIALAAIMFVTPVRAEQTFQVLKVVDGDTLSVDIRGKKEVVRLLGIDTPETVDPRKPVQCFGKAASDKMKTFVAGKSVILIDDSTQGNRDKYNRLLRYVYLPDKVRTFVNGEMVKQGYAFSYKEYPTKMLVRFNAWEKYAREHSLGLWGACPLTVTPTKSVVKKPTVVPTRIYIAPTKQYIAPTTEQSVVQPVQSAPAASVVGRGGDKNCPDFATHAEAQAYFDGKGGSPSNNVDGLDRDHDGIACEALP